MGFSYFSGRRQQRQNSEENITFYYYFMGWRGGGKRNETIYWNRSRGYKTELILKRKIKHKDWLLAEPCPQATDHCALF